VSRLKPIDETEMDAAQIALRDAIQNVWKRSTGGPFDQWYLSPDMGLRANALTDYCRWGAKLEFDVLETAILTTAAHWAQPYQWNTHVKNALNAGLSQATIDAIRAGEKPIFATVEQSLAHDVAREILDSRKLSAETYARAVAAFGEPALVDLAAVIGWYASLAIQMNIFDVGAS
jgi:4-carboxymuconolactone decarboxylase